MISRQAVVAAIVFSGNIESLLKNQSLKFGAAALQAAGYSKAGTDPKNSAAASTRIIFVQSRLALNAYNALLFMFRPCLRQERAPDG